jgi:DNA-binding LacI/PurR family transcriptional regulator
VKVTIKDIAREAGVSPSTVSRVMAGSARISDATAQRVRAAMERMRYQPNHLARSLAQRKTHIVGVVFPQAIDTSLEHPFYPEVLRGIGAVAAGRDYHILLANPAPGKDEAQIVRRLVYGGVVDGLILLASRVSDTVSEELLTHRVPFVVVGHPERDDTVHWVDNDNVYAGRMMTEYVIALGHRHIAFLGSAPDFRVTVERLQGYLGALSTAGIDCDPGMIIPSPFNEGQSDAERVAALFTSDNAPTAVVAGDDFLAIWLMGALARLGLRVPGDVSITGFNHVLAGRYTNPPLTTVDIGAYNLGKNAFSMLYEAMMDPAAPPRHALLPIQFVRGASVARCAAGGGR